MKAALVIFLSSFVSVEAAEELRPLLAQPDQVVLQDDFEKPAPLDKSHWAARQGTRWAIEEGVLRGRPSSAEYQTARKDHKGLEARISVPVTPAEFVARFSFRFVGGTETSIVPFVEFGHHVCRLRLSQKGAEVLAEGETVRVAESEMLKSQPGKWYHALAELKGEEFVIQFAGGPTLYARHPSFARAPASGGNGLGIAGPQEGAVEMDNVTLWTIKPGEQANWTKVRAGLPTSQAVTIKKAKVEKKAKT